jgi:FkbM family methyltransferase
MPCAENMNINNFDWGKSNDWYKSFIGNEVFNERIYEKFFNVQDGDIVFDAGASIGIFGYSVIGQNPKKIYCVEPSQEEMETLKNNIPSGLGVYLNYGISNIDGEIVLNDVYENGETTSSKSFRVSKFSTIIEENNIEKIDFLKTDCEGGEYDIFSIENLVWLKQNMGKASGEWHLFNPELKLKFREFRDVFLRVFPNHRIFSTDGIDIKWDLWNDHFIDYYTEVMIYLDNTK